MSTSYAPWTNKIKMLKIEWFHFQPGLDAASVLPRPFDSASWTQVHASFGSDGYTCIVLSGGNMYVYLYSLMKGDSNT
ncbi:hypothetical protein PRUPE_7G229600 [Prunus persica]|uniref:Uncharacterized protein n=1 Tax=Prunus persica TaxID=3760 RepID=M5WB53_PRUPE|nr:hypothetical protein PRUPE_7G229600 [Prunus persica]